MNHSDDVEDNMTNLKCNNNLFNLEKVIVWKYHLKDLIGFV